MGNKVQELRNAEARVQELNREASELPERIRDASKRAAKEKAEAARAGGALLAVASESEITELQQRQQALPFERWAADLRLAEAQAAVQGQLEADAGPAVKEAKAAFEGAHQEAEEASRRADEARSALFAAERRQEQARHYRRDAEKRVAQLEGAYPGGGMSALISVEEAAAVVLETVDEQLLAIPDELHEPGLHARVMENVLRGLAEAGLYDVAGAVMRTSRDIREEQIYNALMGLAGAHGDDEGMVFQSVYGLRENL